MPRPDVSAERTEQIMAAAVAVYARQGVGDTRMEDIASEAGLSKATLYLYFDSKDALTQAILESFILRELASARVLLDAQGSATERLRQLVEKFVADVPQLLPLMALYLDFLSMALRQQGVQDLMRQPLEAFLEILEQLIQQGIDAGEFRQVDSRAAALMMATLIDGTLLVWGYDPEMVDVESQIRFNLELMLQGLSMTGG